MKKLTISSLLLLVLFFYSGCEKEEVGIGIPQPEKDVLHLINQHRVDIGLPPLEYNITIAKEAEQHSHDMAKGIVEFGHAGFSDRINRLKSAVGGSSGSENVAYGFSDAESVVNAWLQSAGHKKNIESNATITGIGVTESEKGSKFYTQIFLK